MAFDRPHLRDIISRIESDYESRLPGGNAKLKKNLLAILARMEAGAAHELYGAINWLAENLLPDTQDETVFQQWADVYAVERLGPTFATGAVHVSGAGNVPQGTLLVAENGKQYQTLAEITVPGTVAIEALVAGEQSNLSQAASLGFLSPIAGVNGQVTIAEGGITGGAETERVEAWQLRLLQRLQNPPRAGTNGDYIRWALESHPAITDVWVNSHEEGLLGVVTVRIATYGHTDGDFPLLGGAIVGACESHINSQRNIAGDLIVKPPIAQPVDLTLAIRPDNLSVKEAITANLRQFFIDSAQPAYINRITNELEGRLLLSHITQAIGTAAGLEDYQLQSIGSLLPAQVGNILAFGTITWGDW